MTPCSELSQKLGLGAFHETICALPSLPSALAWGFEWEIYSRNVRAYVRMCRSRLGMSICGIAVNLRSRPGRISGTTCINTWRRRDDVFWWRRTGRTAQLGIRSVRIWRSHVQKWVLNTAWRLATLRKKKKTKRSVHRRARREQERVQQ